VSVLVACRGLDSSIANDLEHVPIPRLHLRAPYDEALAAWGAARPETWSAVMGWRGRSWGDLVNDAVADASARALLVQVLGSLARGCVEVAIWYAGFPDEVPTATSPGDFDAIVNAQLAVGELEPAARLLANP
jgi:hypothetical protein